MNESNTFTHIWCMNQATENFFFVIMIDHRWIPQKNECIIKLLAKRDSILLYMSNEYFKEYNLQINLI